MHMPVEHDSSDESIAEIDVDFDDDGEGDGYIQQSALSRQAMQRNKMYVGGVGCCTVVLMVLAVMATGGDGKDGQEGGGQREPTPPTEGPVVGEPVPPGVEGGGQREPMAPTEGPVPPGAGITPRYDVFPDGMPRAMYRPMTLRNGLRTLLISSPAAPAAAASVDVGVGSLSNPEEFQGLAHFLEHMLFRGSKRYPHDNEFSEVLSRFQGHMNAYTADEHTNYFFSCSPPGLAAVLDVFAGFFDNPLFKAEAVTHEVHAVDNEHAKNRNRDDWRYWRLETLLGVQEGNPLSLFGTGDLKHLNKPGIRDALIEFHKAHYRLDRMTLVVLAPFPMQELEALVDRTFATIPTAPADGPAPETKTPVYDDPAAAGSLPFPYPEEYVRKRVTVQPVLPTNRKAYFRFGTRLTKWDVRFPEAGVDVLSFVLNHDGAGTFKAEAIRRGLALSVDAGTTHVTGWFTSYVVMVELTEAGVGRVDELGALLFAYLDTVAAAHGGDPWGVYFDKMKAQRILAWELAVTEAGDMDRAVSKLAADYAALKTEHVLRPPSELRLSKRVVDTLVDALTPENMVVLLFSATAAGAVALDRVDPEYGTRYHVAADAGDYSTATLPEAARLQAPPAERRYPAGLADGEKLRVPMEEIPPVWARFEDPAAFAPRPVEGGALENWVQPSFSLRPSAEFRLRAYGAFETPEATGSAARMAARQVLSAAYHRLAVVAMADARAGGMAASVYFGEAEVPHGKPSRPRDAHPLSFDIAVTGLSPDQPQLLGDLAALLTSLGAQLQSDQELYAFAKGKATADLEEITASGYAVAHAADALYSELGLEPTKEAALAAMESLTLDDVLQAFHDAVGSGTACQALLLGSFADPDDRAARYREVLESHGLCLKPTCADETQRRGQRDIAGWSVYQRRNPNALPTNDAVVTLYQLGEDTAVVEAQARVLDALIAEPAFNQLRSMEELGYVVACYTRLTMGRWVLMCLLQSDARSANYLDARIENFVGSFGARIEAMADGDFDTVRTSMQMFILQPPSTQADEIGRTWGGILDRSRDATRLLDVNRTLAAMTKESLLPFFAAATTLNPQKFSVELFHGSPGVGKVPDPKDYVESNTNATPTLVQQGALAASGALPAVILSTKACA